MSGRGRMQGGRGRHQAGRGSFKTKITGTKTETKKTLTDYNYYLGSAKQASDYENTTDFLINYIKKTYDDGEDVATALKELKELQTDLWAPTMRISSNPDFNVQAVENEQFKIQYASQYNKYEDRCHAFKNNKIKAYRLLWERCTKGMKNKIEDRSDFETIIHNNPIELLKAIKEHALNYQETHYVMSILVDTIRVHSTPDRRRVKAYRITQNNSE
jgi:hypothetical protein